MNIDFGFVVEALESVWDMLNEMSPYLLLGFLIAGLMHAFVPGRMFTKYLSGKNFRSVVNAALLGIPLPLCSCGVIPTAMSLRREGASKGSAVSFLIATPQTGVDSILASYSLLGLPFAIIRPIAALFTALFGGVMVNVNDNENENDNGIENAECRMQNSNSLTEEENEGFFHKLKEALEYAYIEMMEDIGKWLVIGIVIAGLISMVPNEYFALFKDNTFASILLVLVMAIPMYLCATGSIPIAVALMLKGLTPGAALVMLMAGPASNMASIMVIGKVLGRRTLITYLASIISGAIVFALLIDFVLPADWFIPTMMMSDACCHEEPSWFGIVCSIALIVMIVNALFFHHECGCGHCHCNENENENEIENAECRMQNCAEETQNPKPTTHNQIKVKGMNCNHCASNVKKVIESVEGTSDVTVNLSTGEASYTGDVPFYTVKKAIESLGFEVVE